MDLSSGASTDPFYLVKDDIQASVSSLFWGVGVKTVLCVISTEDVVMLGGIQRNNAGTLQIPSTVGGG